MSEPEEPTIDKRYPVSFVVITCNEDLQHLAAMVETLPEYCEVCILSNMQGTEESLSEVETLQQGTRTIHNRKWIYTGVFHFGQARNYADEMATNDWRFWIDSDDRLASCHHKTILRVAKQAPPGIGGAFAGVASYEPDYSNKTHLGFGIISSDYQLRMYRGSCGAKWSGRIHEQIYPDLKRLGWGSLPTNVIVIHEGYNASLEKRLEKMERNVELLLIEVNENQDDGLRSFYANSLRDSMNAMTEMQSQLKQGL
jgi:glycosyltransferase involved in cell wall biosynthesis